MMKRLRRVLKVFAILTGVLVLGLGAFLWWASGGGTDDRPVAEFPVRTLPGVRTAPAEAGPAGPTIISFNIAYGRGPAGDDAGPWSREHIERHLEGIAAQIRESGAEVVALQEVDLDSSRSHRIDEPRFVAERLGWPHIACVPTWENNYVPYPYWPPSRHYGRMRSGQCVLSQHPLRSNTRYRLPQPEGQPFYYNAFYLHRALQRVVVDLGGREIVLWNVHLEAFDAANRRRHMDRLLELLAKESGSSVVVAGDFNALPPGAPRLTGFADEPEADFRGDTTMERALALKGFRDVLTPARHEASDPATFTFPADDPSRRLDYMLVGDSFDVEEARVLRGQGPWSDHLPLLARLRLRAPPSR